MTVTPARTRSARRGGLTQGEFIGQMQEAGFVLDPASLARAPELAFTHPMTADTRHLVWINEAYAHALARLRSRVTGMVIVKVQRPLNDDAAAWLIYAEGRRPQLLIERGRLPQHVLAAMAERDKAYFWARFVAEEHGFVRLGTQVDDQPW